MFASKVVQVFATLFGWFMTFHVKIKSETHEALLLGFILHACISYNGKEIIFIKFQQKHEECFCKPTASGVVWLAAYTT